MSRSTYANVLKIFAVQVLLGGGAFMEQAASQGLPQPQNRPSGSFAGNRDARQEARRALEAQLNGTSGSGSGASSISGGANTGATGPSFAVQPGFVQQGTTPQNSAGLNSGATTAGNAGPLFQNRPGVAGVQASERAAAGPFATAGMRAGDNLLSINGQSIQSEAQLLQVLRSLGSANQPVNVVISRGGAQQTIFLQPGAVTQALGALQQGLAGAASAQGTLTASNTSPSPALGPTGANTNGTAQSTTPATPSQPSLTSGIIRGPSVTSPSSSIQGVGADLQNPAITPSATTGVNTSGSIATTGSATPTNGTVTTGTGTGAVRTGDTSVTDGTAVGVPATASAGASSGPTAGANTSKRSQGGLGPGMQSLQVPSGPSLAPGIGQPLPGTVANPATLASPNAGVGNSASGSSAASSGATTGGGDTNAIQGLATGTPSSQGTLNSSVQGGFSGVANPGLGASGPGKGPAGAQGKAGVRGGATGGNAAGKGPGGGGAGGSGGGGSGGGGGAGGGGAGAGGT